MNFRALRAASISWLSPAGFALGVWLSQWVIVRFDPARLMPGVAFAGLFLAASGLLYLVGSTSFDAYKASIRQQQDELLEARQRREKASRELREAAVARMMAEREQGLAAEADRLHKAVERVAAHIREQAGPSA
jgi:hypothetical protein